MLFRRHIGLDRKSGDTGGGATGGTEDANAGKGGAGSGGSQGGDTSTSGDAKNQVTPEQQIANITKERDEAIKKHDALAKRIGEQGNQIATLKKIDTGLRSDPKTLLSNLAKSAGLEIYFDKPQTASAQGGQGDGKTDIQKTGLEMKDITATFNRNIQSYLNPMQERMFATQHKDWDVLADERSSVKLDHDSGTLTDSELLHFAARGRNLGAILADAKQDWEKEYIENLARKNKEQQETGGAGGGDKGNTGKKAAASLEQAVAGGIFR